MVEDRLEWNLEVITPLGDGVPRWVKECRHLYLSNSTQDETMVRRSKSHKCSLKLSRVSLYQLSKSEFYKSTPSIYRVRVLNLKRQKHTAKNSKLAQKTSHMGGVTCIPTLAPPKTMSTPPFNDIWKVWLTFVY